MSGKEVVGKPLNNPGVPKKKDGLGGDQRTEGLGVRREELHSAED